MISTSTLALSLLFISNTPSLANVLNSNTGLTARGNTPQNSSVLGPQSQLHIANEFIAPDGFNRSATLVNGVYPGPLIKAEKNDQFSVEILNELTDSSMPLNTSVHWHGISQQRSNWADGTSYVTQCPIRQQETFVPQFNVAQQTGTYWYHSHYLMQYCDGLRGPLVIYDPDDPLDDLYDVDDENTVITLSDWYHEPSTQLSQIVGPVIANSTLINGKGRYAGGPPVPLAVVNVEKESRYRFRVLATSCGPSYNFSIDGHRMTIIEADGVEVDPVEVDSFPILAAQRYSVVVKADKPVGNYWIRALSNLPGATFDGGQNLAILRYDGAPDEDPTSSPGPYELSFNEGDLHPLIDPAAPGIPEIGQADVNLQLAAGFTPDNQFTFGGVSWKNPSVPVLLQILSGARQASQLLPAGSVYTLPPNKVIEISFTHPNAAPGGPHPIHLHGHHFSVVRVAGSNQTNFVNPVRRDTVSMGDSPTDNVTIRFVTDNAGPWFLHCHIDWHLYHGFAVVMAEAPDETATQESAVIPEDWYRLCEDD